MLREFRIGIYANLLTDPPFLFAMQILSDSLILMELGSRQESVQQDKSSWLLGDTQCGDADAAFGVFISIPIAPAFMTFARLSLSSLYFF